jgi:hypothetical protein
MLTRPAAEMRLLHRLRVEQFKRVVDDLFGCLSQFFFLFALDRDWFLVVDDPLISPICLDEDIGAVFVVFEHAVDPDVDEGLSYLRVADGTAPVS